MSNLDHIRYRVQLKGGTVVEYGNLNWALDTTALYQRCGLNAFYNAVCPLCDTSVDNDSLYCIKCGDSI